MVESLFYTVPDMCKLLNISRATLDRMCLDKEIPGRKKWRGKILFHKSSIHHWINSNAIESGGVKDEAI